MTIENCTRGRSSGVESNGLLAILINRIHHTAQHRLSPILHLHRSLPMDVISLLAALQRRTIECDAKGLQLRQIKHDRLDLDKCRELLRAKGREALVPLRGLDASLDLLRPLEDMLLDCGGHVC